MTQERLSTGIPGLDELLLGGFIPGRTYLVRGGPGSGKTTVGLHFLTTGVANEEKVLFITLGEQEANIRKNAETMGFDLKDVAFLDLSPTSEFFSEVETYDIFSPAEVEREPTTQKIVEKVEEVNPQRVFLDAMTQFRYLAPDEFQFRKQALSFLRFLVERETTVLFTSESGAKTPDEDLQFLADGIISLEHALESYTLSVTKFRGSDYLSGRHSMQLSDKGMEVFPKLKPEEYEREFVVDTISSGVPELDELLHGGLERGTITIITGPTGVGKTTLGIQFMKEAAGRGERSVIYTFEEAVDVMLKRCEALNIPVHDMIKRGTLSVVKVEPLDYTPDKFARVVRHEVEEGEARIVMIDSMAGYSLSFQKSESADMVAHLHALSKYLANMGVTTILINEVEYITGEFRATEMGISHIADNIVFLRYLEIGGQLRKAIGVLKKRLSDFERTLREFEFSRYGIKVGAPLSNLRGILSGRPEWVKPPSEKEV